MSSTESAPELPPAPQPDPIKELGDRLTALEGRQDKDDSDKRRDLWLKVLPILVSVVALLVSGVSSIVSYQNTQASIEQLKLKEQESVVAVRLADILIHRQGSGSDEKCTFSFRIVNAGAPISIEEVEINYQEPVRHGNDFLRWEDVNKLLEEQRKGTVELTVSGPFGRGPITTSQTLLVSAQEHQKTAKVLPFKLERNEGVKFTVAVPTDWRLSTIVIYTTSGARFDFPARYIADPNLGTWDYAEEDINTLIVDPNPAK